MIKCGLAKRLLFFNKKFDQFNKTGAQMFDSIYHDITLKWHLRREKVKILSLCTQRWC